MEKQELAKTLFIDLSARTGPVRHGACGFLYGLGKAPRNGFYTLKLILSNESVADAYPDG
jgi:hypothetical protein